MKKITILIGVILLLSMAATASSISVNCTLYPVQFNFGNSGASPATLNCPSFASIFGGSIPALTSEDSLTLGIVGDFQFGGPNGTNDVRLTVTPVTGGGTNITGWAVASPLFDVTGTFSSSGTSPTIPILDAATFTGFTNAFTVSAASAMQTGSVETSSVGAYVTFGYSSGVPEPTTMSLIGIALLGLGAMVHKGRKA